jgi:hypothetical protein
MEPTVANGHERMRGLRLAGKSVLARGLSRIPAWDRWFTCSAGGKELA